MSAAVTHGGSPSGKAGRHDDLKRGIRALKLRLLQTLGRTRLYQLYNRKFGTFDHRAIESFIHEYSRSHSDVFFIQVGANDGITWDPYYFFIRRDRWNGIVIEPQRDVFHQKLQPTYRDCPGIQLMNVAVDAIEGPRPLYRYAFSSSRWATGLASFDKERLIANFNTKYVQSNISREQLIVVDNPDNYLTTELVPCVTFDTILDRASRDTIDFLITDVEGHDVKILDAFPFGRVRPANIIFELPMRRDASLDAFLAKLRDQDYDVFISQADAIAMLRGANSR